jgi:glucosamine 6-phosphate synthetase-like amidotransferase/phosphosugar isomerase protein
MCGVCGIIAPHSSQEWRFETLSRLLKESQLRGSDATGIAFVNDGKMTVLKNGVSANEFIKSDEFKALEGNLPPIVIAHTRASSRVAGAHGAPLSTPDDNKNNHPFYSPHSGIALLHNGKIDDEMWRDTAGKARGILHPCDGQTDSEILLRVLETFALADGGEMMQNIEDMCFNVSGGYTVVLLRETEPNKVWFVRHSNPLHFGYLPQEDAVVFASTDSIIEKALETRVTYLNFFWKKEDPDLVINSIADDHALEIGLTKKNKKFKIRSREIEPATSEYKYHVMLAEKEQNETESSDEREAIVTE